MGSCLASTVVKNAQAEIGYKEGKNNWTIYAQELDNVEYFNTKKQNVAWCSTFCCDMVFRSCTSDTLSGKKYDALYFTYQPSKDNCACGCKYCAGYFRSHNAWYTEGKAGDFVFYGTKGNETHQGIVERVYGDGSIDAIEGNHGDAVARVHRTKSEIAGFGRPRYDSEPAVTPKPNKVTQAEALEALKVLQNYVQGN